MIRVRITEAFGSTPRDAGTEMLVGQAEVSGTIGGGQLEYMAIERARRMLREGEDAAEMTVPLGPEIGQCCGGKVILHLDRRGSTAEPRTDVLIFGAGHVGRAIACALRPLPFYTTVIDQREAELAQVPGDIRISAAALPEALIRQARPGSAVIILTHEHALDFLLAAEALARADLAYVGMIGSATKRARFCRFASSKGVDPSALICPIGVGPLRDKRPEIIAAFTATELLARLIKTTTESPAICDI